LRLRGADQRRQAQCGLSGLGRCQRRCGRTDRTGARRRRRWRQRHDPGRRLGAGRDARPDRRWRRPDDRVHPDRWRPHPGGPAAMRVILAEASPLLRQGLARLLADAGVQVVATVANADALRAAVEAERPDIVVTDIRMPPDFTDEGLVAAVEIRSRYPGVA